MLTAAHCFVTAATDKISQRADIKHGQCQSGKTIKMTTTLREMKQGTWEYCCVGGNFKKILLLRNLSFVFKENFCNLFFNSRIKKN